MVSFDLVLVGGSVVDGTGSPARYADIGVTRGRISAVGSLQGAVAGETLDISGFTVAPGFIDTHQHSDLASLLVGDQAGEIVLANVRQGVTTEVTGNCGFSPFPAKSDDDSDVRDLIAGILGVASPSFRTLGDYRDRLVSGLLPTNLAPLVGHGTIRATVMGFAPRPATSAELDSMRSLLLGTLNEGAFGLSSGLVYAPGIYADRSELIDLAAVAGRYGRPYVSHIRDEMDAVIAALEEAVDIGRTSGASVHISHHKLAGRRNWGRSAETLTFLESVRNSGQNLTADVYPYTSGSTILRSLLPPWVQEGGPLKTLERIGERATQAQLRREFVEGLPGWQNLVYDTEQWGSIFVANSPTYSEYEGLSIANISSDTGRDPVATVSDILRGDRGVTTVIMELMNADDVWHVADQPFVFVGSDAISLPGKPHPRIAGTFARVLKHYGGVDLPAIVHRITELPATRFGIPLRGSIKPGNIADLVMFHPTDVVDRATYSSPLLPPKGISHVLINGTFVIRDSKDTGSRPGRVLSPV